MSDEREKPTWKEIDQRRSGARAPREDRPRGKAAQARAAQATRAVLEQADELFASPRRDELAKAVRDARGSAGFDDACRAYHAELGTPRDAALLSVFLDSGDADLLVACLEALLELAQQGALESSAGLRTQLRLLAEHSNDNVAGAAEDLLELA